MRQNRCASQQAADPASLVAERVKERVDDQVPIARPDSDLLAKFVKRAKKLALGAQHALGFAGGAGGEQQVADMLGRYRGHSGLDPLQGH